jgi:AhpD family alkylhydroperoxidase
MQTEDKKRTAYMAVVSRALEGDGKASRAERRAAFENAGLAEPLRTLIDKVARQPTRVTNEDIAAVKASGESEDQIFELVVCAAIGQATRQYEAACAALDEAMTDQQRGNMRLTILNNGYRLGTKMFFAFIRVVSRQPVPDAAKLVFYRPDFYGALMKEFTHEAMRGPSAWSVGGRELMAAFVSKMNACAFCIGAHTATAAKAYHDEARSFFHS